MTLRLTDHVIQVHKLDRVPDDSPILDKESTFHLWMLVCMAIASVAFMMWGFGFFKTPTQQLTDKNQDLTEKLSTTQDELTRIKSCVGTN